MKFFSWLFIAVSFFPLFSFAQGNYKTGYIVTSKGDTTKGFIDLKGWSNNPVNINFKTSLANPKAESFGVNEISYFEVAGITAYKAFTVSISLDETNIARIGHERDTSTRVGNVFLKVEEKGMNVTLYSFQDDIKERFYLYDSQSGKIAELAYRIYFIPSNNQNVLNNVSTVSQDAWKQQLSLTAQKYDTYRESFSSMIADANYNDAYLKQIVRKINNTSKQTTTNEGSPNFGVFLGAGVSVNTITPSGTFPFYNPSSHNSSSLRAAAGVYFDPHPEVGNYLLKLEVAYWSANYETLVSLYFAQPNDKTTYKFGQKTISIIPQLEYNIYNTAPFKVYIDAGLSINKSTYTGNTINNTQSGSFDINYLTLNPTWFSIPLKVGIVLQKHFNLAVSYSFPISLTDDHGSPSLHQTYDYSLKISSVQAGLTYVF